MFCLGGSFSGRWKIEFGMDEAKPGNDDNKELSFQSYLAHPFSTAIIVCDKDISLI